MNKPLSTLLLAVALATSATSAMAQQTQGSSAIKSAEPQGPGKAPAHSKAAENSNAPQTGSQKRGQDRASERAHDKAGHGGKKHDEKPKKPEQREPK